MLKERGRILAATILVLDLSLIAASFFLAYWIRDAVLPAIGLVPRQLHPLLSYLPLLPVVLVIWGTLLLSSRQYRSHRTIALLEEATDIVRVTLLGAGILILTIFVFRLDELLLGDDKISRLWILLLASVSCCLLLSEKLAIRATARYVRARGFNYRSVLVVGTGPAGQEIASALAAHRYWGFKVLGFIASDSEETSRTSSPFPVLGGLRDLSTLVEEEPVDDVVFAVSRRDLDRMEDLFLLLQEQGIRTRFALNLFPHTQAKVDLEELTGVPLITFSTSPNSPAKLLVKRLLDLALSSLLLLLGLPVVVLVAIMIKISSRGQVLFRQTRCGLHGRRFTLYKFRTMIEGAEERQQELLHLNEMNGPVFKLRDDPRVTRLGRILRKFSLDEIPQLWNVMRGDMSLVGPRPPIPEEVARYQRWQRRRLAMKPGLTCLWQISGRNDIDFERWMRLDLEYIDSWSPMLDMKILIKTIPVVLSGKGAS